MGDFSYYINGGNDITADNYDLPSTPDKAPKRKRVSRKKSFAPSRRNLASQADNSLLDGSLDLSFEVMDGSTPLPAAPKRIAKKRARTNANNTNAAAMTLEKSSSAPNFLQLASSGGSKKTASSSTTSATTTTSDKENIGAKVGKNGIDTIRGSKGGTSSSATSAPSKSTALKAAGGGKDEKSKLTSAQSEKEPPPPTTRRPLVEAASSSSSAKTLPEEPSPFEASDELDLPFDEPPPPEPVKSSRGKSATGRDQPSQPQPPQPPPSAKPSSATQPSTTTAHNNKKSSSSSSSRAKGSDPLHHQKDNSKEVIEGIRNLLKEVVKEEKDGLDARAKQVKSRTRGPGKKEYDEIQAQKQLCDRFLEKAMSAEVPLIDKREWEHSERTRKRKRVKVKRKLERQVRVLAAEVKRAQLEKAGWDEAKRKHRRLEEEKAKEKRKGDKESKGKANEATEDEDPILSDDDAHFLSLLDTTPVNLTNQLQYLCLQVDTLDLLLNEVKAFDAAVDAKLTALTSRHFTTQTQGDSAIVLVRKVLGQNVEARGVEEEAEAPPQQSQRRTGRSPAATPQRLQRLTTTPQRGAKSPSALLTPQRTAITATPTTPATPRTPLTVTPTRTPTPATPTKGSTPATPTKTSTPIPAKTSTPQSATPQPATPTKQQTPTKPATPTPQKATTTPTRSPTKPAASPRSLRSPRAATPLRRGQRRAEEEQEENVEID